MLKEGEQIKIIWSFTGLLCLKLNTMHPNFNTGIMNYRFLITETNLKALYTARPVNHATEGSTQEAAMCQHTQLSTDAKSMQD